jgi:hypothetical protein
MYRRGHLHPASWVTLGCGCGWLVLPLPLPLLLPAPVVGVLGSGVGVTAGPADGMDMMCTMPGGSHLAKQPLQLSVRHTRPESHCLLAHGSFGPLQSNISPAQPAAARWAHASRHASTMSLCAIVLLGFPVPGVCPICCSLLMCCQHSLREPVDRLFCKSRFVYGHFRCAPGDHSDEQAGVLQTQSVLIKQASWDGLGRGWLLLCRMKGLD